MKFDMGSQTLGNLTRQTQGASDDLGTLIQQLIAAHITPHLDDDSWHEVVGLLIGSLPPAAAEQVLLGMAPKEEELIAPKREGLGDPRGCYEPAARIAACLSMKQTNATTCNPAKVLAYRS